MKIPIDRHNIVVVWKNNDDASYNCAFCSIRNTIENKTGTYHDINGNCPINLHSCICRFIANGISFAFNNKRDTILATVYKCNMEGSICTRDCSRCGVNKLINLIKVLS